MNITITIPLPPAALKPNSRPHWSRKARAAKAYRKAAWAATVAATSPGLPMRWRKASVQVTAFFKTVRHPDPDNLIASLKAAFDGIADAGLVADDKELWPLRPIIGKDAEFPRIELTISPEEIH
jgi:crossover junction endodeoxyribonuclease RusA